MLSLELRQEPTRSLDTISFAVKSNRPAFVYCFLQDDESGQIRRILPNGSEHSSALPAGQAVTLPPLSRRGGRARADRVQTLACFATAEDRSDVVRELMSMPPVEAATRHINDLGYINSQLRAGATEVAAARFSFGRQTPTAGSESGPRQSWQRVQ